LQRPGRCPRCGYALRFDGRAYTCDFCGYPRTHRGLGDEFNALERELKARTQGLVEKIKRSWSKQVYVYYPVAVQPCISCGSYISIGTPLCPNCGANQQYPQRTVTPAVNPSQPEGPERNVLDYIIAHNGTISLSQASQDLALPPERLQSTIERLKAAGFLSQT
jgi:predicted amidophosphoribosyltransferase